MVFQDTPDLNERPDWQILQNGWSSKYLRPSILNKDLDWFRKEGFQVAEMEFEKGMDWESLHIALQKKLLKKPQCTG